jgi:WD40 repeat protein
VAAETSTGPPNSRRRQRPIVVVTAVALIVLAAVASLVALSLPAWSPITHVSKPVDYATWSFENVGGFTRGGAAIVLREPTGGTTAALRLYDTLSGKPVATLGEIGTGFRPFVSPDATLCVGRGADGRMLLWGLSDGRAIALEGPPHIDSDTSVVDFRPDGQAVLVADASSLLLYDREGRRTRSVSWSMRRPRGFIIEPVTARYVDGGAKILVQAPPSTTPPNAQFLLLDSDTLANVGQFGPGSYVAQTVVSSDGKRVVAARAPVLNDGQMATVETWDLSRTATPHSTFANEWVSEMRLSPDGATLYFRSGSNYSSVVDLTQGATPKWKRQGFNQHRAAFSPSGDHVILHDSSRNLVQFRSVERDEVAHSFHSTTGAFVPSSDGRWLAVLETPQTLVLWKRDHWRTTRHALFGTALVGVLTTVVLLLLLRRRNSRLGGVATISASGSIGASDGSVSRSP